MEPESYTFFPPNTTKRGSKAYSERHPAIILLHQEYANVVATIHWTNHNAELSEVKTRDDYSQVFGPAVRVLFGWFADETIEAHNLK
jgi:hypothetical protein